MYAGLIAVLSGCTAPLVPELIIEADVPAELTFGGENARLGELVGWNGHSWVATAPGTPAWWVDGHEEAERAVFVGYWGDRLVVADGDRWTVDGEEQASVRGAQRWAAGPAGVIVAVAGGIWRADTGEAAPIRGVQAVAVGVERFYVVACDDGCVAVGLDGDLVEVARWSAGTGGAVGEWQGAAWAGDPEDTVDEGTGSVCSEAGECVHGEPGDHLGRAIGGGMAAGTFNKWIVPARARIVPLDGGTAFALERGAENQAITLAGDVTTLIVGAPYYPVGTGPGGLVAVVPR